MHCPDLQELGIVIDVTVVNLNPMEKPGGAFSHRKLTTLHLGDSSPTGAPLVAVFLSDIVPRVTKIPAWQRLETETREVGEKVQRRWEEVQRLSTFVMVREQERHWSEQTRIIDASGLRSPMPLGEISVVRIHPKTTLGTHDCNLQSLASAWNLPVKFNQVTGENTNVRCIIIWDIQIKETGLYILNPRAFMQATCCLTSSLQCSSPSAPSCFKKHSSRADLVSGHAQHLHIVSRV